ncbi:MAG: SDR family oxidoreductase [Bacteroidota bacterium]|nr:SDR family oxidoreductase [Bacteroidota bacterium]
MNSDELSGKRILVTGASSGIGKQTAIKISRKGGSVFITGRNKERLEATFHELEGSGHLLRTADLTVREELNALIAEMPELNGVVYSTGISDLVPCQFISEEDIRRNFSVSFEASVLLTSLLLRKKKLVKNNCSLVFVSSLATKYPFFGGAMYISSKAALESYARTLAFELAPKGIRVNCVRPAFIKGPMMQETQEKISKGAMDKFLERQPLGPGEPEDVANAIVFYLSPASRWISASNLDLGGG